MLRVQNKIDRMGGMDIPIAFLLERQHVAFAERVVLRAMCRALNRHLMRVARAAFASWKAQIIVLRVLEDHARHELLVRQTTLAHACAVVQRKHHARMRELLLRWSKYTNELRAAEQNCAAVLLQRCWRKFRLLVRFKRLARAYRDHVRDASATLIQSAVRRCLARQRFHVLVAEHRRSVAVVRIQHCYSNYQLRKIAFCQRQREAALVIQRCWRGECGRRRVRLRRQQIRAAADRIYLDVWRRIAVGTTVFMWRQANVIQRCVRAFLVRRRVAHAAGRNRRRRGCLPASRIQRAFRGFRSKQLTTIVSAAVGVVVVRLECAALRIQRVFRLFMANKRQQASMVLTALFRCFRAKKLAMQKQLAWLESWSAAFLRRWSSVYSNSRGATKLRAHWSTWIATLELELQQLAGDQHIARSRLQTRVGFQLLAKAKRFHLEFVDSNVNAIQRNWRWHRLRAVLHVQLRAAQQLQTLLPLAFRSFKRRRRRRQVLGRWKRQRFVDLKTAFQQWRAFHSLVREARSLKVSNESLRRVKWFRHQKLRKRVLNGWKAFMALQRERAARFARARAFASLQCKRRSWRIWSKEHLPALTVRNRLNELTALLHTWHKLREHWRRRKQLQRASEWHRNRLKRIAVEDWKCDVREMNDDLAHALRYSERLVLTRSFSALRCRVALLKQGAFRRCCFRWSLSIDLLTSLVCVYHCIVGSPCSRQAVRSQPLRARSPPVDAPHEPHPPEQRMARSELCASRSSP